VELWNPIVGESFGQEERLTVRLRGLIRAYPRSVGIVKEFLQNADDAGATLAARGLGRARVSARAAARPAHGDAAGAGAAAHQRPGVSPRRPRRDPPHRRELQGGARAQDRALRPRLQHRLQRHRPPELRVGRAGRWPSTRTAAASAATARAAAAGGSWPTCGTSRRTGCSPSPRPGWPRARRSTRRRSSACRLRDAAHGQHQRDLRASPSSASTSSRCCAT
jgi:hypothetical protein